MRSGILFAAQPDFLGVRLTHPALMLVFLLIPALGRAQDWVSAERGLLWSKRHKTEMRLATPSIMTSSADAARSYSLAPYRILFEDETAYLMTEPLVPPVDMEHRYLWFAAAGPTTTTLRLYWMGKEDEATTERSILLQVSDRYTSQLIDLNEAGEFQGAERFKLVPVGAPRGGEIYLRTRLEKWRMHHSIGWENWEGVDVRFDFSKFPDEKRGAETVGSRFSVYQDGAYVISKALNPPAGAARSCLRVDTRASSATTMRLYWMRRGEEPALERSILLQIPATDDLTSQVIDLRAGGRYEGAERFKLVLLGGAGSEISAFRMGFISLVQKPREAPPSDPSHQH